MAELFTLADLPTPRFHWVPSPAAGAKYLAAEGLSFDATHDYQNAASTIAALITGSRREIIERTKQRRVAAPSVQSRLDSAAATIAQPLRTSLVDGVAVAIRQLVGPMPGLVTWYGQQEAHHLAYFAALQQLRLVTCTERENRILDLQGELARSTGWWWVTDDVCVMSERPTTLHTEPTPNAANGELRMHHSTEPAVQFSDGTGTFVLHGTAVPDWVICDPSVGRISTERNAEIRRCAIERIGWDTFVRSARLRLVDRADDPGNVGQSLELYATPRGWTGRGRILLTANGSLERDGTRRRYGLAVPSHFTSALDAAGWTYGVAGRDYTRLARRT